MKRYSCSTCGTPIEVDSVTTKPKIYCGDNCRDYFKFKQALERSILKLCATSDASRVIRGDMFRLANLLSNGTKFLKDEK